MLFCKLLSLVNAIVNLYLLFHPRMEREREEKRKAALKFQMQFTPEDLALATIPGMSFDPRERAFSIDELRPQPIIRKRKKVNS